MQPGARFALASTRNHITVDTGWQPRLQDHVHVERFVVERHKADVPAGKRDLVVAIVPPVLQRRTPGKVAEVDHAVHLAPPVLAHPAAAARLVRIDDGRQQVALRIGRRALVKVGERERAHDAQLAVRIRGRKRGGHLVRFGLFVRENTIVTALIVVIVHEHERIAGRQQAPRFAKVRQPAERVISTEGTTKIVREHKLRHCAEERVLKLANHFVRPHIDDFLREECARSRRKPVRSVEVVEPSEDHRQIGGPHVFGRIHAESGHSELDQMVQEVNDTVTHPRHRLVQIVQSHQLTVPDLLRIAPIVDGTRWVKVGPSERYRRELTVRGNGRGTSRTDRWLDGLRRSHVVDDDVHVQTHAGRIAAPRHVRKLSLRARSRVQLEGNWLIPFPPRPGSIGQSNDDVLVHWRQLHTAVPFGPQEALTLVRNVAPFPLEQMHDRAVAADKVGIVLSGYRATG
uniref:Uncharacterized protein n=1 Tax=Anopheles merus TaxID=30066 RepID=A0A182VFL8_ANOME